jgi:NADPH:quinone reductase-like Zn-dependent oxidoreductase
LPAVIQIQEVPKPILQEGWVLIKIKAFGLNRSELFTRQGHSPGVPFPRIQGIECVGEVEEDPSGTYKKGQKVAALMGGMGRDFDGGYAEYTVLPKSILFPFESKVGWEQLGAFPEMFQTVYGSLHLALRIQKGETLLIRGGTSSIGMLAAQMAKNMGLKVIATTRYAHNEKILIDNGADEVLIDDGALAVQVKQPVDKLLELIGTGTLKDSLLCVKPGGSVCMSGMLAEQWVVPDFQPIGFIPSMVNLTSYNSDPKNVSVKIFQDFIDSVESGKISLNVKGVFHLDEIVQAHELMESNKAGGKIVVLT